jgi:hypothetical protein
MRAFRCGWLGLTADGATGYTEGLSDDDHSFQVIGQVPELTHKATLRPV